MDVAWRRPGEETVESFLKLAQKGLPGVVLFDKQVDEVVGYALGEPVVTGVEYEVITAWVHPRFKGLAQALRLYFTLLEVVYAKGYRLLKMDVIEGGLDRSVDASLALRVFRAIPGAMSLLINSRQLSYRTEKEQFESIRMYTFALYYVWVLLRWCRLV